MVRVSAIRSGLPAARLCLLWSEELPLSSGWLSLTSVVKLAAHSGPESVHHLLLTALWAQRLAPVLAGRLQESLWALVLARLSAPQL